MANKRKKSFQIKTAAQLRIISSPVPLSIIQTLQHLGPSAINDLGPKIGREANSLHYHMRKLLGAGIVRQTSTRLSGARTEAIYDVVADRFIGSDLLNRPELQKLTNESVAALLRLATRDFAQAGTSTEKLFDKGNRRNIAARRLMARLTGKQLKELNECLNRITEIFTSNIGSEDGQMCALTTVLAPINTTNK